MEDTTMIFRVNLATRRVIREERPKEWSDLGGRALTSAIISNEVPPRTSPLSPRNKLILAPGLMGNSGASCSGRLSIGAKSPLTGTIKESNVGGRPGQQLARMGVEALIFEGISKEKVVARIHNEGVELLPYDHLAGLEIYQATEILLDEFSRRVGVLVIGPAGEQHLSAANIGVTDIDGIPSRHAGRGGLGAVMGNLGLKAIVIDPEDASRRKPEKHTNISEAQHRFSRALLDHPSTGQTYPKYGTSNLVALINTLCGLPAHNFSRGQFELAKQIDGDALYTCIASRGGKTTHTCMPGCVIRCSNKFVDNQGQEVTRGFEYESITLLGANCGIGDLDMLAQLNRRCDDLGLDTIEMGVTLAVAMEAEVLSFGDAKAALAMLDEAGRGSTPLGRVLGHGAAVTGKVFGVSRVPVVKGQALPAYDPRALKGTGVTYATSPMGADHTAGNCLPGSSLPDGTIPDPHNFKDQVRLSRYMQHLAMVFDTLGLCWFSRAPILDDHSLLTDMLVSLYGNRSDMDGLMEKAHQALQVELNFNKEAGFTTNDDRLPEFFSEEPLSPLGLHFDINPEELQTTLEN
jgi:aldehyde:ferredoxin oxidoreductase